MTQNEIIQKVSDKLSNRPDTKYIHEMYLNDTIIDAVNDVCDYINHIENDELSERLVTPIYDLCMMRLNQTGSEGLSSSGKGGTSETYIDNIPKQIRHKLKKYRRFP